MGKILCGIITVVESWLCLSVQHNKEQGLCSVSVSCCNIDSSK
uniref:Uncharacterized protein n=1 Tax=Setaria italica TaxID=4555 RepID=K3ZPF0_SETIT